MDVLSPLVGASRHPSGARRAALAVAAWGLAISALVAGCGGGGGGGGGDPLVSIGVWVVALDPSRIEVDWVDSGGYAVARYEVRRDGADAVSLGSALRRWIDSGLAPGSPHCYRVDAIGFPTGRVIGSGTACTTTPAIGPTWRSIALGEGEFPAIAVDASGAVHAAWRDGWALVHARVAPDGTVATGVVDPVAGRIGRPSIVVDRRGQVLVAYRREYPPGGVWLASTEGTGWSIVRLGDTDDSAPAFALAPDGGTVLATRHIVGTLQLWTRTDDASWRAESVPVLVGYELRVAFDGTGALHVATAAGSAVCGVEYMRRSGDAWTTAHPSQFHGVGCGVGLGVGPDGTAHVAYMVGDVLRVTRYGPSGSASSEPDRFDWIGSPSLSAAVDAQGRPHVAYADPGGLVKHAVRIGDAWVTTPISGGGDTPELAMLPDGRAAIVHAVSGGVRGPISLVVGGE